MATQYGDIRQQQHHQQVSDIQLTKYLQTNSFPQTPYACLPQASQQVARPPLPPPPLDDAARHAIFMEPRHALPVPTVCTADGMLINRPILGPFQLEHQLDTSNREFYLPPEMYQRLVTNPYLHLQLKCYHRDGPGPINNWPVSSAATISVQVAVNGHDIPITNANREIYVKHACKPAANILTVSVSQCCCVS
jgi:hypothetical protein